MDLRGSLKKLFITLSSHEKLLRLLHYIPANALDNPLDTKKPDINSLPNKYDIVEKVLMPSDKKYDLDLKSELCRVCFYTGTRELQDSYNSAARRQQDNIYVANQKYNFDVYVHVDIDIKDFRMTWICNTLNEILDRQNISDIGKFRLAFSSPINNTPDGFIGYKLVYVTSSSQ
ncbi:hypothetical protein [Lysinibacillus sp. FSL K6-0102]|uniref:hypothetical protein n=1 Tax=Lysinibacillus sp. FSL K6-0102 TaxID=2975290 RepID=UPI0030F9502E